MEPQLILPGDPTYIPKYGARAKMEDGAITVDKDNNTEVATRIAIILKGNNVGFNIEKDPLHGKVDARLVAEALHKLVTHYPGYTWRVAVDDRPYVGMLDIYNEDVNDVLGNQQYGYRIHLRTAYLDPNLKCVVMAGGEILERALLPRGWNKGDIPKSVDGVKQAHQPPDWLIKAREDECQN